MTIQTLSPTSKAQFLMNAAAWYLRLTWNIKAIMIKTEHGKVFLWRGKQ